MLNKTEPRQKSEKSIESKQVNSLKDCFKSQKPFNEFFFIFKSFLTLGQIFVSKVNIR